MTSTSATIASSVPADLTNSSSIAIAAVAPTPASTASGTRIVPVTVITGYLGAGKTTTIRTLMGSLPPGYTCAWLKNEYGDAAVDSAVAADSRIAVREVTNGCLCCTKVGELEDAMRALHEMSPDRILVEASGSALPGPLVWEIQKLPDLLRVDGVVTVVDCLNFERIQDFSRSARVQAQCTDLVLLNKCEVAGEHRVDLTLDDLNELVPDVPKVRTVGERAAIDPALVFGLDAGLWRQASGTEPVASVDAAHMFTDAETYHVLPPMVPLDWRATRGTLEALLRTAPRDDLYRTKGIVPLSAANAAAEMMSRAPTSGASIAVGQDQPVAPLWWLFNGVAGRLTLEPLPSSHGPASLVLMGRDLRRRIPAIAEALRLPRESIANVNVARLDFAIPAGVARGLVCAPCD